MLSLEEPCAKSKESLEKLKIQNQSRLVGKYNNEFSGKIYSYSENGINQLCLARLALESLEVPTMSDMIGNMFGSKKISGSGDFVEADVRLDSVYQSTQNPDLYAGVEGNYDMGNEWTILKKR